MLQLGTILKMNFLGIYRKQDFSPNMQDKDAAILQAVGVLAVEKGHSVDFLSEDDFLHKYSSVFDDDARFEYDIVFTMARGNRVMDILKYLETNREVSVFNSAFGIHNCNRSILTRIFVVNNIPTPKSWITEVSACPLLEKELDFPCWIKRGDGCAQHQDDVAYAHSFDEVIAIVDGFKFRGINNIVINKHLEGDLVKFYGVEGTDFFDWGYASEGHSKFGLEVHNSKTQGYPFDEYNLKKLADTAARLLNVPIYGGDCIISSSGEIMIIDFNDWPSFSRCRENAAQAIFRRLINSI